MISRDRFELALEQLKSSDWERFEHLASGFLTAEFPQLRTMASPSGDGGRDAEFCGPFANTVLQYSIRSDWDVKIKQTIKRIGETKPGTAVLIYVSNQSIGALSDPIKVYAADRGIFLDIRDRKWFGDRLHLNSSNESFADELATAIVDPFLAKKHILIADGTKFSGDEARTALFYLEMQWRDENTQKGLTRSCFEALVKVALRGTDSEHRVGRDEIYERVQALLPHYSTAQIKPFVDSALIRLKKLAVRHWPKIEEFNLSYEENQKIKDNAAGMELLRGDFKTEIIEYLNNAEGVVIDDVNNLADFIIELIEKFFLKRGEEFAAAVARDLPMPINDIDIKDVIIANLSSKVGIKGREPVGFLQSLIVIILNTPSTATAEYVNVLSDAYTLFAFLAETPDVQAVTKKLFSHGDIWVDTTVLLPVFAEQAYPEGLRPFTTMFSQAQKIGLKLLITPGIIEEIERHLNRCCVYDRTERWEGRVPYVYTRYALAGKSRGSFRAWAEQFFGNQNPQQDIADYLKSEFGIQVEEIKPDSYSAKLPDELINQTKTYWEQIHSQRRHESEFSLTNIRLAQHDTENYLNALVERQGASPKSVFGFKTWWLTLDSAARELPEKLSSELKRYVGFSPIMSINFLIRYMTFGPNRDRLNSTTQTARVFSSAVFESLPPNLVSAAQETRERCGNLPEAILQRRIRDSLDHQKAKFGTIDKAGLAGADEAIFSDL